MKLVDQLLQLPAQLEDILRRDSIYEELTKVSVPRAAIFCIWDAASIFRSRLKAR